MSEPTEELHRYENDSLSSTEGDEDDSLSESSPGEPDYEQSYTQELSKANLLLRKTNVLSKPIKSVEELQKCASSMFVAVIESMLNRRIKNIVRVPKRRFDYVRNAQSVIDVLSVVLQSKLQVSAQQISEGHLPSICNLVSVFSRTIELIASKRLKIPESLLDASLFVSSRQSERREFSHHHHGRENSSPRRRRSYTNKRAKQLISAYGKSIGSESGISSKNNTSSGYDRAIELLGGESEVSSGKVNVQDDDDDEEENLPPSYSEDTLLPRRHRHRMANLLRLERKQQAAVINILSLFPFLQQQQQQITTQAYNRQQLRTRKLFRMLEKSQRHSQIVDRVRDQKFKSSLFLQQASHLIQRQSKEAEMWKDVKKALLRISKQELREKRSATAEKLRETMITSEQQLEAEDHVFQMQRDMIREAMKEEEESHKLRASAQMEEFRRRLKDKKTSQREMIVKIREKYEEQHKRRMAELEENIESVLRSYTQDDDHNNMMMMMGGVESASASSMTSTARQSNKEQRRHIQLLEAYGS